MKGINMLQIRKNVFETNSSSTHSITMCSRDEYDAWLNGKMLLNDGWWSKDNTSKFKDKKLVTRAEAEDIIRNDPYYGKENLEHLSEMRDEDLCEHYDDNADEYRGTDYGFYTFNEYVSQSESLEWYDETYTTKSGDEIVAFGMYGYDY